MLCFYIGKYSDTYIGGSWLSKKLQTWSADTLFISIMMKHKWNTVIEENNAHLHLPLLKIQLHQSKVRWSYTSRAGLGGADSPCGKWSITSHKPLHGKLKRKSIYVIWILVGIFWKEIWFPVEVGSCKEWWPHTKAMSLPMYNTRLSYLHQIVGQPFW